MKEQYHRYHCLDLALKNRPMQAELHTAARTIQLEQNPSAFYGSS